MEKSYTHRKILKTNQQFFLHYQKYISISLVRLCPLPNHGCSLYVSWHWTLYPLDFQRNNLFNKMKGDLIFSRNITSAFAYQLAILKKKNEQEIVNVFLALILRWKPVLYAHWGNHRELLSGSMQVKLNASNHMQAIQQEMNK